MTVIYQVSIIAILFLIGIFCYKKKIITPDANKSLSSLVINIVNPAILINSYQIEFSADRLKMLMYVFALSFLSYAIIIPLSYILNRKGRDISIDRIASIYSNCGFIGIPIVNSLYGAEGVFLLSGFITVFNILFWTHGISVLKKEFDKRNILKIFLSPAVIAIFIGITVFVLRIDIVNPIGKVIEDISLMTTPLIMIIAGVSIAQTDFLETIKQLSIYKIALLRLILLPLIVYGVFLFIPLPDLVKNIVIFGCACPVSTMGTIVTINTGGNYKLMSQYFAATTVLSLFTLPIMQLLISVNIF